MTDRVISIAEHVTRIRRRLEREEVERRLNRWPAPARRPTLDEIMRPVRPFDGGDAA